MNFNVNSPFAQLKEALFSAPATGRSVSGQLSGIAQSTDPYILGAHMPANHGVSRNAWDMVSGAGAATAAKRAAPIAQGMQDAEANANWGLQRSNANESFGNSMLGTLVNNAQVNNDPRTAAAYRGAFANLIPRAASMFGSPAGASLLSSLLGRQFYSD